MKKSITLRMLVILAVFVGCEHKGGNISGGPASPTSFTETFGGSAVGTLPSKVADISGNLLILGPNDSILQVSAASNGPSFAVPVCGATVDGCFRVNPDKTVSVIATNAIIKENYEVIVSRK